MKIVRRGALPVGGESGLLDVRDRALAAQWRDAAARRDPRRGHLGTVRRPGALVHRRRRARAAAGRDRRGERHGRRDAAARARPAADGRGRSLLLRARRVVPEPRAEPAAAREPRVHHPQDDARRAPTSASRTTATPTGASSSTTRASSCRAISRRRCSRSRFSRSEPGGKVIYDVRASWAVPEAIQRAGGVAARSTASVTRSSSSACARRTRSSAARCRRTTTSATSRRPTRASCRSC